jgi:hypothetical protein
MMEVAFRCMTVLAIIFIVLFGIYVIKLNMLKESMQRRQDTVRLEQARMQAENYRLRRVIAVIRKNQPADEHELMQLVEYAEWQVEKELDEMVNTKEK